MNFFRLSFFWLAGLLAAFSSLSTKSAGVLWLFLPFFGIIGWLLNIKNSNQYSEIPTRSSCHDLSFQWVLLCILAFILVAIPTAYWGGPWQERHPQIRLLLAALGTWLLIRRGKALNPFYMDLLLLGGATALFLAFAGVLLKGSNAVTPTNRIPWIAGLSVFSCALLSASYLHFKCRLWIRRGAILMCLLTPVTVLLSGVRGSWALLFVMPAAFAVLHKKQKQIAKPVLRWILWILFFATVYVSAFGIRFDNPFPRLHESVQALIGVSTFSSTTTSIYNSSTGVRIGMYQEGLKHALHSGWLGYGHQEHKRLLIETFTTLGVEHFANQLGHYHSDMLNAWSELGLLGLMAYLTYLFGLIFLSSKLWTSEKSASVGLWALTLMHATTGLTNMNFAHNYYPIMLSLAIALLLLSVSNNSFKK